MAEELAGLMRTATENLLLAPQAAEDVIHRYQRKRRRRVTAVAVFAAGALVAAVADPLATTSSSGRRNITRIVPASSAPAIVPLASVSGVDLTYLPAGFVVVPDFTLNAMVKEDGQASVSQYYRTASANPADTNAPELSLAVQRDFAVDLDTFARDSKGMTESWTTVQGQRALLQTSPVGTGPVSYELTWVAAPETTVTVFSSGGVPLASVMRVAEGLVVHSQAPRPANPSAAEAAVRQVVLQAFTGGEPASVTLGAIENGEKLAPVLAKLARLNPLLVRTADVRSINVTFVSTDRAVASTGINFALPPQPHSTAAEAEVTEVTVNDVDGRWLVSQSSYCAAIGTLVGGCPSQ